ncbi:MAG: HAD-IIB family hydrolase [Opitutales bacterium]
MKHSKNGTDSPPKNKEGLYIALLSLHGLIRAENWELGRDADTGGQIRYVVELANALGKHPQVRKVELITRQIIDPRVHPIYSHTEEEVSERVSIRRIPFGPRRYLHKEKLWPYLDIFVDNVVGHFRRQREVPDILHGHYADAGQSGAQLARLLGIPFVFTGHSLGRVKRERLSKPENEGEDLEKKYAFRTRIEAEEFALETASLVVASTFQEVEDQYEAYDHYVPERMEVIPPGVDLTSFSTDVKVDDYPEVRPRIARFLDAPEKPMLLAMARPDERKNLEELVHVYGQSEQLRDRANLVLITGNREDIRDMPAGQRRVMRNLLTLIDTYNLYGLVAYPKGQEPDEVPAIYRLAAETGGVFVNIALTEPFGLTLLEAAASGLPVVATNDGGPRDILANCRNGLLVGPTDREAIEKALLSTLDDEERYQEWCEQGSSGAKEFYPWERHVERYMREVLELHDKATEPALPFSPKRRRRLPDFDRLLVADIDNTLTGDAEGLEKLVAQLHEHHDTVGFGIATGRSMAQVKKLLADLPLPQPDVLISSAGTEIHYGHSLVPDRTWEKHIRYGWEPKKVRAALEDVPGVNLQDEIDLSPTKISYQIDPSISPNLAELRRILRTAGLRTKVVVSHGIFLDIIPVRAGSGMCIRHLSIKWGFAPDRLLVAGDSGNDEEMLRGNTLGIVVGNYSKELNHLKNRPRIHFADASHAWGVLEGIDYYDFFGAIKIPNDHFAPLPADSDSEEDDAGD